MRPTVDDQDIGEGEEAGKAVMNHPFPLLQLPSELRIMIYGFCAVNYLGPLQTQSLLPVVSTPNAACPALLTTCKQVAREVQTAMFRDAHVQIRSRDLLGDEFLLATVQDHRQQRWMLSRVRRVFIEVTSFAEYGFGPHDFALYFAPACAIEHVQLHSLGHRDASLIWGMSEPMRKIIKTRRDWLTALQSLRTLQTVRLSGYISDKAVARFRLGLPKVRVSAYLATEEEQVKGEGQATEKEQATEEEQALEEELATEKDQATDE